MQSLNISKYADVLYDKEKDYIIIKWHKETNDLFPEEGFQELENIYNQILPLKPKYILFNIYYLQFPITEDFLEKVGNELFPKIMGSGSIEKTAYVVSENLIMKVGIEGLNEMLHTRGSNIRRRIFENEQEAIEWLFK